MRGASLTPGEIAFGSLLEDLATVLFSQILKFAGSAHSSQTEELILFRGIRGDAWNMVSGCLCRCIPDAVATWSGSSRGGEQPADYKLPPLQSLTAQPHGGFPKYCK